MIIALSALSLFSLVLAFITLQKHLRLNTRYVTHLEELSVFVKEYNEFKESVLSDLKLMPEQLKTEALMREAETYQNLNLQFRGVLDAIQGYQTDLSLMQKELGEFSKNLESDEMIKLQDRLSTIEFKIGIFRMKSKQEVS